MPSRTPDVTFDNTLDKPSLPGHHFPCPECEALWAAGRERYCDRFRAGMTAKFGFGISTVRRYERQFFAELRAKWEAQNSA